MAIIRIPFDTSTNTDLLKEGTLHEIFDNTVREAIVESDALFNMETVNQFEVTDTRLAGFEGHTEIAEGQNLPIQTPQRGGNKVYTQRVFGTGFRMTYMMDFFNKYNLWNRYATELGKVMTESKDIELATVWNNVTSTTLTCGTGFDALALASATHTGLKPASTDDNYSNYGNASLSLTALQNARYYFSTLIDDMGFLMGSRPDTLYFESTLWPTVTEILESPGKWDEMSNTTNIWKGWIKPLEYRRLTSTTSWGILAKGDKNYDIKCLTSLSPKTFTKDAPDNTQDRIMVAMQFFTYGWGDPRGAYIGKT